MCINYHFGHWKKGVVVVVVVGGDCWKKEARNMNTYHKFSLGSLEASFRFRLANDPFTWVWVSTSIAIFLQLSPQMIDDDDYRVDVNSWTTKQYFISYSF